jgi:hypothetical protein
MGLNGEWKKEKKKKLSHDWMTPQNSNGTSMG